MKKKILVYMDRKAMSDSTDSTAYVVRNLADDREFDVKVSDVPDPGLAKDCRVVFCRFDIPVKYDFLTALSEYDDGSRLFINPPLTKRDFSDKRYLQGFADAGIIPETLISNDPVVLAEFIQGMSESGYNLVSKPIDGNGGKGIYRLSNSQVLKTAEDISIRNRSRFEMEDLANRLTDRGENPIVLQKFLDGVERYGDTRVNVLFYEPVSAILRMPKEGSFKGNLSAGAKEAPAKLVERDFEILERIAPFIRERRAIWTGVDILGSDAGRYLGEINFPSPGALYDADLINGNKKGIEFLVEGIRKWEPEKR